ncbi:MAG: lysylphosphatidylglycerol synthase transmembrane domain-containing protein [Solirubrobacteraceae bacterium]
MHTSSATREVEAPGGVAMLEAQQASRGRLLAGALVSVASVGGCVWWASKQTAPRLPSGTGHLLMLAAAVGLYALTTLARGWRWDVILRAARIDHQHRDAYGLVVVGYMGNTVLPARGGEVLRVLLLSQRSSARRREALGTILPERILDAAALVVLFALLTLVGTGGAPAGRAPAYVALGALVALLAAGIVYLRLRIAGRMSTFADRVRPVARASRLLLTGRGVVLGLVSLGIWLAEAAVLWLCIRSLGLSSVSMLDALLVDVLGSFFALIPAGPGYAGTYDAALLFALHALKITGGAAISVVLLFRFVVFVPITLAGLVLMVVRYGGLHELRARSLATR